jgi:hypothetical protein
MICALLLACAVLPPRAQGAESAPPGKFAGTYKIAGWRELEARGLYHFFYLHPGGRFYLAGEWPGSESSRFGGAWSVQGDRLNLVGVADVKTSRGAWRIPFQRSFRIETTADGLRITPLPEKNRYGLLGWPDAFVYFRGSPAVNIPGGRLPGGEQELAELSEALAPANP